MIISFSLTVSVVDVSVVGVTVVVSTVVVSPEQPINPNNNTTKNKYKILFFIFFSLCVILNLSSLKIKK
jgi:hypothetical protein